MNPRYHDFHVISYQTLFLWGYLIEMLIIWLEISIVWLQIPCDVASTVVLDVKKVDRQMALKQLALNKHGRLWNSLLGRHRLFCCLQRVHNQPTTDVNLTWNFCPIPTQELDGTSVSSICWVDLVTELKSLCKEQLPSLEATWRFQPSSSFPEIEGSIRSVPFNQT